MLRGYLVTTSGRPSLRYFSKFVGERPYFANMKDNAMIFDTWEMAYDVAEKCQKYSGWKYKVVDVHDVQNAEVER